MRLKNFDYSTIGGYFVTICTYQRIPLLGKISEGKIILSSLGIIAQKEWLRTSLIRPNIALDEFVIMPNHIHGIIIIRDTTKGTQQRAPTNCNTTPDMSTVIRAPTNYNIITKTQHRTDMDSDTNFEEFGKPTFNTIPTIIRGYKSAVKNQSNSLPKIVTNPIWQKNYYEHIIRDENDLNRIREYIQTNPMAWEKDEYFL